MPFFNKKTALFFLLILLFVAVLSCGQLSLGDHGGTFGMGTSECSTVTSATSLFSPKESLALIGTLLLLVVLNAFARQLLGQEKFYELDPPKRLVVLILKQVKSISNRMREAFRKGIIHSQIYNGTKASG